MFLLLKVLIDLDCLHITNGKFTSGLKSGLVGMGSEETEDGDDVEETKDKTLSTVLVDILAK